MSASKSNLAESPDLREEIPIAFRAWSEAPPGSVAGVPGGTLNFNFEVTANGSRFFLRCYRANLETERIVGEHDLLEWIAGRGIPVPVPLQASGGGTLAHVEAHRWALFPWMPGRPVTRGELSAAEATSLGAVHGRIQAVLANHPESDNARMSMRWDKGQSLNLLTRLVGVAEEKREPRWIVDALKRQRTLLDAMDVSPPERFASLPCQLLHGDFHDQQALFLDGRVTAIVDWEIWHADPRAWELARSLAFSKLLPSPRLDDYLAGYREHVQLSEGEVVLSLELWFQSRVVGLWAWWAYLMEGNQRVAAFFPEMIAELERVTDQGWKESVTTRVVRAAV